MELDDSSVGVSVDWESSVGVVSSFVPDSSDGKSVESSVASSVLSSEGVVVSSVSSVSSV